MKKETKTGQKLLFTKLEAHGVNTYRPRYQQSTP